MARLFDRLLADGSAPLTGYDLMRMAEVDHPVEHRRAIRDVLVRKGSMEPTSEQVDQDVTRSRNAQRSHRSTDSAEAGWPILAKAQVIIGDEVGHYLNSFPDGIQLSTLLLTPVVPPFGHVFVDFRRVPNPYNLEEFGVLLSTVEHGSDERTEAGAIRWTIYASLYGSWDGRTQVGPIVSAQAPLDSAGNLVRVATDQLDLHDDVKDRLPNGLPLVSAVIGGDLHFEAQLVDQFHQELLRNTTNMLYMALLTVSFTHVKNVNVVQVDPDPKQSRAFHRRHGRPLNRHYVLDIGGTRNAIAEEVRRSGGIERAWHRCRGHFATYTSERPLFGRQVGTFWVPAHVRGTRNVGTIEKDYRPIVGNEFGFGRAWRDDDPDAAPSAYESGSNPDLAGRGWRAHADTVNRLAAHLVGLGVRPVRAGPEGPQFDCAWARPGRGWAVAEVKSITDANEADQIRRGIGQVIDYRHALAEITGDEVTAVLVVEAPPSQRWVEVCVQADIVLTWPTDFDRLPS